MPNFVHLLTLWQWLGVTLFLGLVYFIAKENENEFGVILVIVIVLAGALIWWG